MTVQELIDNLQSVVKQYPTFANANVQIQQDITLEDEDGDEYTEKRTEDNVGLHINRTTEHSLTIFA